MYFIGNPKFRPETSQGIVAQMEKVIDTHSYFLENIKAGAGVVITKNADGGITIESNGGSGGTVAEGDYAFKVYAVETDSVNWNDSEIPEYEVRILNGTAQVFGGTPWALCGTSQSVTLESAVVNGQFICIQYEAFNPSTYAEIGDWSLVVLDTMEDAEEAPATMTFAIAQIGDEFANNVNQMHKGNIVMPSVSNVVDIQGPIQAQ